MNQQTVGQRRLRLLSAIVMIGIGAWDVSKCLGWIAYYSAYLGDPGMGTMLANAHRWAVSYACVALLLVAGATMAAASCFRGAVGWLAPTRYVISVVTVVAAIGVCVLLAGFYGPNLHHSPGLIRR